MVRESKLALKCYKFHHSTVSPTCHPSRSVQQSVFLETDELCFFWCCEAYTLLGILANAYAGGRFLQRLPTRASAIRGNTFWLRETLPRNASATFHNVSSAKCFRPLTRTCKYKCCRFRRFNIVPLLFCFWYVFSSPKKTQLRCLHPSPPRHLHVEIDGLPANHHHLVVDVPPSTSRLWCEMLLQRQS